MHDCLIVGGGVIGLSLAYELATRKRRVCVLERGETGRAASWAGAGMLPPASATADDPVEVFCHYSNSLHARWAAQLQAETGIDVGYRPSGALYVARDEATAGQLAASAERFEQQGIHFERQDRQELVRHEPALDAAVLQAAWLASDECQIRNPRLMKALAAACRLRGVEIYEHTPAEALLRDGDTVTGVQTPQGVFRAARYCIAGGAWTAGILETVELQLALKPIRGQIALLRTEQPVLARIINEGPRYLVPREDGRIVVGSTMEDVGFDTSTTDEAIADLLTFAHTLVPSLKTATLEAQWAGLRPASRDGQPYLGIIPGLKNAFVAAGHTRGGLQLAPATAVVMAAWMCDESPELDLTPFRVDR